jgi:hypothetical protein
MNSFDAKKTLDSLSTQTYSAILNKYKKSYEVNNEYDLTNSKRMLNNFLQFFKKTLANLKDYKEIVQSMVARKDKEIENYNSLLSMFSDFENNVLIEYSERNSEKLIFNSHDNDVSVKILKLVNYFKSERENNQSI